MKEIKTKVDLIVEKGNKRLDKFYKAKLKQTKRKQQKEQYLQNAKIDSCLKLF